MKRDLQSATAPTEQPYIVTLSNVIQVGQDAQARASIKKSNAA